MPILSNGPHGLLALDDQSLNAVIVARGLLYRATLTPDGTAPGAIAAVILYDVAVETAAKAALRVVQPGRMTQRYLPQVLDQLHAEYRVLQADDRAEWRALEDARQLHEDRNRVQHHGSIPSPQDLDRARVRATDFVSSLVLNFFGRQLAELSRAKLVQDKEVRAAIEAADQSLAEGQLAAAVGQLSIAFEVARIAFRLGQPYESRKALSIHDVRSAMSEVRSKLGSLAPRKGAALGGLGRLERLLETLVRRSERAEDRLEALSLGAQASDYLWFRGRFPRASRALGSDQWDISPTYADVRYTREEVIHGLDFVTTVALHWQQFPPAPSEDPDQGHS
jgi:hypothetical protein